jgi:signal peptidase II
MFKKLNRTTIIFTILIITIILDQISKIIARDLLHGGKEFIYLNQMIVFKHTENTGAFLSLGANLPEMYRIAIFVILVLVGLCYMLISTIKDQKLSMAETICISLIIGGGYGNLIDRVFRGSVTDFVNLGIGHLRTGIFNVADVAVTTGAIIMGLIFLKIKFMKKQSGTSH